MSKRGKGIIEKLEGIFSGEPPIAFSEEELLGVIKDPRLLAEKSREEQILLIGAIVEKMDFSYEFRNKVLEEITTLRQKNAT